MILRTPCVTTRLARLVTPVMLVAVTCWSATAATASPLPKGTLVTSYDFGAAQFELDAAHHRLYASVPGLNSVAIINTQTLELIDTVFVGSNPFGLGLSENGSNLYVGNRGSTANAIAKFDTQTLSVVTTYALPVSPLDVAVGKNDLVYASTGTSAPRPGILTIDGTNGDALGEIGTISPGGLLELTPDRMTLFEQRLGYSPSYAYKFDLTGDTGNLVWRLETGSNGQDLAISHNGDFFAAPNGAPYDIKLFRTSDGAVLGTLNTGAYPDEVTFSPDDLYAYAVHTRGLIDVFRTDTFLSDGPINILGEASELMVDETGQYLFASVGDEIRVYATGQVPEPSSLALAGLGCVGLFWRVCRQRQHRRGRKASAE